MVFSERPSSEVTLGSVKFRSIRCVILILAGPRFPSMRHVENSWTFRFLLVLLVGAVKRLDMSCSVSIYEAILMR